jgi:hypothetical protein
MLIREAAHTLRGFPSLCAPEYTSMLKLIPLLFSATVLFQCQGDAKGMKAYTYAHGTKAERRLTAPDQETVKTIIAELFEGTSDMLRVRVDDDRINDIRTKERAIEIVFDQLQTFKSNDLGSFSIRRLFIPVTGDYVGDPTTPSATLFPADDDGFMSGPLGNPNGYNVLVRLDSIITKAGKK